MSLPDQNQLTKMVSKLLNLAWILVLAAAILWPLYAIGAGAGWLDDLDARYVDLFLGFKAQADGIAPLHGHSEVQLLTDSSAAWAVSAIHTEIGVLLFLVGIFLMRRVFKSLAAGDAFSLRNAADIKRTGILILVWQVLKPLMDSIIGSWTLAYTGATVDGLTIYPAFEINVGAIFVGLAVIVLSGVLSEAANLKEDMNLTI